jgi:hypothetical protein
MRKRFLWAFLCALSSFASNVQGAERDGQLLDGAEWKVLGQITGFHSIQHKKSGFEARLLESDGSASVAKNPISLFLVVTNNGTSDLVERTWRITVGVTKVRSLVAAKCGVDVSVDVDSSDSNRPTTKTLRLCFLSSDGKLQDVLKVNEVSR